MADRVPGSGPVYEPLWFTKNNGVAAGATITRGDIVVTATNASQKANTNDHTAAITGFAQALEGVTGGSANGDRTVQLALAGSAIRMRTKGTLHSGQRVKLDVTGNVQSFEPCTAADIAAGRAIATFLHEEAGDLTTTLADGNTGVFILG